MYNKLFSVIFLFSICGCGEKKAPAPERMKSQIIVELMDSLKNRKHSEALKKIERLKYYEKNNSYLKKLERSESYNEILVLVQKELNKNGLDDAIKVAKKEIREKGSSVTLSQMLKKLLVLKEIQQLTFKLENPIHSENTFRLIKDLELVLNKNKEYSFLSKLVINKKQIANILKEKEIKRSKFDLFSDFIQKLDKNDSLFLTILAQYEIETEIKNININKLTKENAWSILNK